MQITLCQGYKYLDIKFFYCSRNRLPHVTTENKTHALTNTFKHYRRSTLRRCEAVQIYINLTKIISLSMLPKHDLKTPMGYHKQEKLQNITWGPQSLGCAILHRSRTESCHN
jgi:hypothetical protein